MGILGRSPFGAAEGARVAHNRPGRWPGGRDEASRRRGTTRPKDDDRTKLTEIIEHLNEPFGTDFKPHDRLFIHHAVQAAKASETVVAQVRANTHEQFSLAASPRIQDWMIDGIDAHQELATRYLDAKKGVSAGKAFWGWQAYPRCNGTVG